MNTGAVVYRKGDLVSIKQDTMMLFWDSGTYRRAFKRAKKPENGIFMGFAKEGAEKEVHEYCIQFTPIKNPCKVAIGNRVCYVDESSFYFYNKRRKYEKVSRSYAE
jgi:hypothetical protein